MSKLLDFITDPSGAAMVEVNDFSCVGYSSTDGMDMPLDVRANLDAAILADGVVYAIDWNNVPVAWRCEYLDDEWDAPDPRPVWQVSADAPDFVRRALHDADVRVLR